MKTSRVRRIKGLNRNQKDGRKGSRSFIDWEQKGSKPARTEMRIGGKANYKTAFTRLRAAKPFERVRGVGRETTRMKEGIIDRGRERGIGLKKKKKDSLKKVFSYTEIPGPE